jgi:hypothetical protein
MIDFKSRSRIFHLYGDGEGLKNVGICLVLRAFEQGGIFIVPHLLRHGTSVFPISSEGPPIQSPLTTHEGCGGSILTPRYLRTGPTPPLTPGPLVTSDGQKFFYDMLMIHLLPYFLKLNANTFLLKTVFNRVKVTCFASKREAMSMVFR